MAGRDVARDTDFLKEQVALWTRERDLAVESGDERRRVKAQKSVDAYVRALRLARRPAPAAYRREHVLG